MKKYLLPRSQKTTNLFKTQVINLKTNNDEKIFYSVCCIVLFASSCVKKDNYAIPAETIIGTVIDNITGKPIMTEQPNGFRLQMIETSWSPTAQAEFIWGKSNGTFTDTKVFAGTYKLTPVEGAFFAATPQTVDVKGTKDVTFTVTPYLNVTATYSLSAKTITATYNIKRTQVGDKIGDAVIFVSQNPNVGLNVNEFVTRKDLTAVDDATILATTYTDMVTNLVSGKTYYVRVGARTKNLQNRYNFTEVTQVVIP